VAAAFFVARPEKAAHSRSSDNISPASNPMYKPFDLSGKVALVTGGNSGIGLGMVRA